MAPKNVPAERAVATLADGGDLSAPAGSQEWAIALRAEIHSYLHNVRSDARHLDVCLRHFRQHEGYRQLYERDGNPFSSWDDFCVARPPFGLGRTPGEVEATVVTRLSARERVEQAARQTNGETLPKGTNQHTEGLSGIYPTASERAEGVGISPATQNRLDYLARNAPELHEAVKRGEIGARTAYEQSRGIKKMEIPTDPAGATRAILRHFAPEQVAELIALLREATQ